MIEPLETRIAPAAAINSTTAVFTDVDGDLVTIKFSKPIAQTVLYSSNIFVGTSITGAEQLLRIDLFNVTPAAAAGVNITFTAVPRDVTGDGIKDGDGKVNVGEIRAAGKNLGSVTIPGDLARIEAGNGSADASPTALVALMVHSLGEYGLSTGATDLDSRLSGKVGKIATTGNVRDVSITIASAGATFFPLGTLSIGGSLIGGEASGSGFFNVGAIGSASIRGDIAGGDGFFAGRISVGKLGSLNVGGSILGGSGRGSGSVYAEEIGTVKIGRDVSGGVFKPGNPTEARDSGGIESLGNIGSISIGGSLLGNAAEGGGFIKATGNVGSIAIGGSIVGSDYADFTAFSGIINVAGNLTSLGIGGSVLGGSNDSSGQIRCAGVLGKVTIGRDLRGGAGTESGYIFGVSIGSVTIGGSMIGGSSSDPDEAFSSGSIQSFSTLGSVSVRGDVQGGNGAASGLIFARGHVSSIAIAGSLVGGSGSDSGTLRGDASLGAVRIGGDLVGGTHFNSGYIRAFGAIASVNIGGSVLGGAHPVTGVISTVDASIGSVTIGGDLRGGAFTRDSGSVSASAGIGKVAIGGSVVGGSSSSSSGHIDGGTGRIGSLTIAGDLRGGTAVNVAIQDSGSIHARALGTIRIEGSVFAGRDLGFGSLTRSGSITADEEIGALTVGGDLVGNETLPVLITAGGDAPVAPTIARPESGIGSITVRGNVDRTFILAGYNKNGRGVSADASVGAVKVGGDWIGSYLSAGAEPGADLIFGTTDDKLLLGGSDNGGGPVRDNLSVSKIASIVIGGQIKSGRVDGLPFDGNQTYGFVAQQIGSFKYDDIVVPLRAGASNDTFAAGKARPLGASRSSLNADGFAMHVFEV